MSTEPSVGQRIAAALRRSPIYVDRSLAPALPPARRSALLAAMRRSPIPIHVIVVPMVKGGTWDDPGELLNVVHDRLRRDGLYLTLGETSGQLHGRQWGGTEESRRNSEDAVRVPFFLPEMRDAALADRLLRAIELVAAGRGTAEYETATAHLRSRTGRSRPAPDGEEGGPVLPFTAGGVAVAAVAGLLVWRWRRGARVSRAGDPMLSPRGVLAIAAQATEEELRELAAREVVAFGESLDEADFDTSTTRVRELTTRALDAYQAAGKVLDSAAGPADLAGVLVLVDQGRDALASARSLAGGGREVPSSPLCFFNPLHGDATTTANWRPLGRRERLRVRTCAACARDVHARRTPEVLADRVDGRPVPYFEVEPERSVWARTGYGQLRNDLVQRVLRGDLRR
ncbi:hypothetical protein DPM19_26030 [Actinomadura craniellae]|uniref:Uncharacterized protein n=1 Tax=Actinomadura craniellae TaxID=2231787 RepID=A0A365GZB6_9ACTN|nr:hypothetical protein [Actinomadura craniellae]RAY12184.1 hypothetical protein DPM19_26030 [Actinomadura craniellae]